MTNILFDYLKTKIKDFVKDKSRVNLLFTCPNLNNHKYKSKKPTATIINGTDKVFCLQCNFKGSMVDIVKLLEVDKRNLTDIQIMEYLNKDKKIDLYPEFEVYEKNKWSCLPVAPNAKNPIEKDWTNKTHYSKVEWLNWIKKGYNIGLRTGIVSNITVVDVDLKETQSEELEEIIKDLDESNTLTQNSPHGKHYIFKYDKDILQKVNINGWHIDIRNENGQVVIFPSSINNLGYYWQDLNNDIVEIPKKIKDKLLQDIKVEKSKSEEIGTGLKVPEEVPVGLPDSTELQNNNLDGCCNDTFAKLGGALIQKLDIKQTEYVLYLLNKYLLEKPMDVKSISAMIQSLSGYKDLEETTVETAIYECLKLMQSDVSAIDILDSVFDGNKKKRAVVNKYLSKFVKEGKAIRLGWGKYKFREKIEWSDDKPHKGTLYPYKIPYFDELQEYEEGDIIVLGGKPGHGKTIVSMNIIKEMKAQGVKCHYIYSESGSRYLKTADKLGLLKGDKVGFYHSYHGNPLSIEIEPNSFTILDWLMISAKEHSDSIFKFFNDEMQRKGGILVIMMQLKDEYGWYAPNMIKQFPSLAARYYYDSEDGSTGHWETDKIRDSRLGNGNIIIPCKYDRDTRILTKKDLI